MRVPPPHSRAYTFWCNTACSTSWTVETKSNPSCFALGMCLCVWVCLYWIGCLFSLSSLLNVSICTVENIVVRLPLCLCLFHSPKNVSVNLLMTVGNIMWVWQRTINPTKLNEQNNKIRDDEKKTKQSICCTSKVWKQKIWAVFM